MKVALVRYRYSPHGGAERYMDTLSAALSDAGAEVRILCATWDGSSAGKVAVERISVPRKPVPLRLLLFARAAREWAANHPEWLLFSMERVPGAEVYRAGDGVHAEWLLHKRSLRPGSWPLDYLRPLNLAYLHLENAMFRSPALRLVIANSNRGREEIVRRFGLPQEKVRVVHNGIDLSRFPLERKSDARTRFRKRFGIPDGETVFLYVGSGFDRKGVGTIARAAKLLAGRGCDAFRIVLAGKGDPSTYVRSAGPASGRLLFTGPVAGADDLFLGADAFVFPTVYEPFSNACLEAMAAGLPVVTTTVNGASEVLREGESGFLLEDPLDAQALANRMERLLSSDLRRKMGAHSREAAEAHPVERNTLETLDLLEGTWRVRSGS
ncbi:MAG: glycosyltransferase family 4 protein [Deltaproteobacteria bacterium]